MTERLYVRVTLEGKAPIYEVILDGQKVATLSWVDLIQSALQFISALRWGKDC